MSAGEARNGGEGKRKERERKRERKEYRGGHFRIRIGANLDELVLGLHGNAIDI